MIPLAFPKFDAPAFVLRSTLFDKTVFDCERRFLLVKTLFLCVPSPLLVLLPSLLTAAFCRHRVSAVGLTSTTGRC